MHYKTDIFYLAIGDILSKRSQGAKVAVAILGVGRVWDVFDLNSDFTTLRIGLGGWPFVNQRVH